MILKYATNWSRVVWLKLPRISQMILKKSSMNSLFLVCTIKGNHIVETYMGRVNYDRLLFFLRVPLRSFSSSKYENYALGHRQVA